jgi:signal transduction histidine kinase
MTPASAQIVTFSLLLLAAAFYLPPVIFAWTHAKGQALMAALVGLYALVSLGLGAAEAFWRDGRLSQLSAQAFLGIEIYGALSLAFLLVMITRIFLRRPVLTWLLLGAIWGAGVTLFATNSLGLPATIAETSVRTLPREGLGLLWAMLGWLIFGLAGAGGVLIARARSHQPMFRNRLTYWLPIFILVGLNDLALFSGQPLPGHPLRLAAAFTLAYAALTHNVPDVRQILRRGLVYVITTLLIVLFYLTSFAVAEFTFHSVPGYNRFVIGAGIALGLAMIFTPLLGGVRQRVDRGLKLDQYDAGRSLHRYSESISNILEVERLADAAVSSIVENMQVRRGFLFLVDHDLDAAGGKIYRLSPAGSAHEIQADPLELSEAGPIAAWLLQEAGPLLHYDIDRLPSFRATPADEHEWFDRLETEVYLPVFAKQQWIGLLALGSKLSGGRFTEADLITLSALADQTGAALENARLVDNLMRLNSQLRQARHDLQRSNQDLERLDQTKSDFISIASHELRTPLTVIMGYTEMLMEDHKLDPNFAAVIKGIHKGTVRLHEIMDSMFDLAQIDARTLQLHLQFVDLGEMLSEVCAAERAALGERKQSLELDLPSLPCVKADPDSLRKVFHHLVGNAIKFTPDQGRIRVTGSCLDPGEADLPEGGVEIIVTDSGVGVDPDLHEIIFSKFHQGGELDKHSTSRSGFKGSGSGLGLALSKGILEAHGGRIWVESPGYDEARLPGSRFHVLLPLSSPQEGGPAAPGNPAKMRF